MIPHIIHYCWFGENELSQLGLACIESWKKYCPDYKIKCWNETNFDVNVCDYTREAYNEKKWAFVSDYARFWILYHEGGIYFDTDVELIKPIDDIIDLGPFMGVEQVYSSKILVNPGLGIGVDKMNLFYKEILDFYEHLSFKNKDGTYNQTTVVHYITMLLSNGNGELRYDIQTRQTKIENFSGVMQVKGIYIYPKDFFCPLDYHTKKLEITENTRSIHHFTESWKTKEEIWLQNIYKEIFEKYDKKRAKLIWNIISIPLRIIFKIHQIGFIATICLICSIVKKKLRVRLKH